LTALAAEEFRSGPIDEATYRSHCARSARKQPDLSLEEHADGQAKAATGTTCPAAKAEHETRFMGAPVAPYALEESPVECQ
jgi:hypothetical protein